MERPVKRQRCVIAKSAAVRREGDESSAAGRLAEREGRQFLITMCRLSRILGNRDAPATPRSAALTFGVFSRSMRRERDSHISWADEDARRRRTIASALGPAVGLNRSRQTRRSPRDRYNLPSREDAPGSVLTSESEARSCNVQLQSPDQRGPLGPRGEHVTRDSYRYHEEAESVRAVDFSRHGPDSADPCLSRIARTRSRNDSA